MIITERELEERFTFIKWSEPISINRGTDKGFYCRYCISMHGFGPSDELYATAQQVLDHIEVVHA